MVAIQQQHQPKGLYETELTITIPRYKYGQRDRMNKILKGHISFIVTVRYEIRYTRFSQDYFAHVHEVTGWPYSPLSNHQQDYLRDAIRRVSGCRPFSTSTAIRASAEAVRASVNPPPPSYRNPDVICHGCQRCGGALVAESDYYGDYVVCIMCGGS